MNISVIRLNIKHAGKLRDLRLQLVNENPITYGVSCSTERRKSVDNFTEIIREYSTENSAIFAAEYNGEFIGMIQVRPQSKNKPKEGYLGSLGVLKKYQKHGVATQLQKCTLDWIKKTTPFGKLNAISVKTNQMAIDLAKRFGFKIVGEGKYRGVPELYLQLEIDTTLATKR